MIRNSDGFGTTTLYNKKSYMEMIFIVFIVIIDGRVQFITQKVDKNDQCLNSTLN